MRDSAFVTLMRDVSYIIFFFFFNDTATTEIYTLPLHDALPIYAMVFTPSSHSGLMLRQLSIRCELVPKFLATSTDRKSTRLNSSHSQISYAVFCLKKKKNNTTPIAS